MYFIKSKCILVVIYGIEACPTYCSDIRTLDHAITATFMKVFNTKSADVVRDCQMAFGFRSLNESILARKINFVKKVISCPKSICSIAFAYYAKNELLTPQNQFANIWQINILYGIMLTQFHRPKSLC